MSQAAIRSQIPRRSTGLPVSRPSAAPNFPRDAASNVSNGWQWHPLCGTFLAVVSTSIEPAVTVDRPVAAPPDQEEVAARGYWELIWIRFRRDRLAVISAAFIVFLIFA